MTLLIETNNPEWMTNQQLKADLEPLLPGVDIRHAPEFGNRADIRMLACVRLPPGLAQSLPNLELVQKLGAGVEAIVGDVTLPPHVQVARLKSETPAQEIAEYCLAYVLRAQRHMEFHEAEQANRRWTPKGPRMTSETTVGVLGLGYIGARVARLFARLGYRVQGWSRTLKSIEAVQCSAGRQALFKMLPECDYVAAILPSTARTRDLFDAKVFTAMKPSAILINVGRGDLIVEADLLAALEQGQLAGAVLDVQRSEPSPAAHPFWWHPNITVTPHVSGWHATGGPEIIAENIKRLISNRPLLNLVDREAGY
jgi:glyoxylate/hydroxypyruvate reductase A